MNRICPVAITNCECIDPPILNISAEAADPLLFIGIGYTPYDPWRPPPLGNGQYIAHDCYGVGYSVLSQEIADLIAKLNAIVCQNDGQGYAFTNDAQTAFCVCRDPNAPLNYTVRWYTVPAGTYTASFPNLQDGIAWQDATNQAALAYAKQQVSRYAVCMSSPTLEGATYGLCLNLPVDPDSFVISTSGAGATGVYTFTVEEGSLPPGLTLNKKTNTSAYIGGTPTTVGHYEFKIRATSASFGNAYVETDYKVDVLGISNAGRLTAGKVDEAYQYQLIGSAPAETSPGVFSFSSLRPPPTGLTIDASTGLISGTVDTIGDYDFLVLYTDSAGHVCNYYCYLLICGVKFLNSPPNGTLCAAYGPFQLLTEPSGCVFTGTLPDCLTLSASGVISGTLKCPDTDITITATDPNQPDCASTKDFTISIAGATACAAKVSDIEWTAGINTGDVTYTPKEGGVTIHVASKLRPGTDPNDCIYDAARLTLYCFLNNPCAAGYSVTWQASSIINTDVCNPGAHNGHGTILAYRYGATVINRTATYPVDDIQNYGPAVYHTFAGLVTTCPSTTPITQAFFYIDIQAYNTGPVTIDFDIQFTPLTPPGLCP